MNGPFHTTHTPTVPRPFSMLPLAGRRLLVVEPILDHQSMYAEFLSRAGAEVSVEGDGCRAVERLKQGAVAGNSWDGILISDHLPGLDGWQATRMIRAGGFTGVIVATTDESLADVRHEWMECGADRLLEKPFPLSVLRAIFRLQQADEVKESPTGNKNGV